MRDFDVIVLAALVGFGRDAVVTTIALRREVEAIMSLGFGDVGIGRLFTSLDRLERRGLVTFSMYSRFDTSLGKEVENGRNVHANFEAATSALALWDCGRPYWQARLVLSFPFLFPLYQVALMACERVAH